MGIFYTGIDTDWFKVFLGLVILVAVLVNNYIRAKALGERSRIDERRVPAIELRGVTKRFGSVIALSDIDDRGLPRRGALPARRQRRRQVDADQDALRRPPPDRGRDPRRRQAGRVPQPARCGRCGRRDGVPGSRHDPDDVASRATSSSAASRRTGVFPFRRFDQEQANTVARQALVDIGIDVRDPTQAVGTLSGGERQSVAIARAVHFGAKVLILDEPTSALGVHQAAMVLKFVIEARLRGLAVIFITHNIHHAYPVGDVFTLLNRGASKRHLPQVRDHAATRCVRSCRAART